MRFDTSMLLHIPIALCDTLVLSIFLKRFLGKRKDSEQIYIITYLIYFITNVTLSILYPDIIVVYSVVSCLIIPYILYNGTRVQRIFCGGLLTAYLFVTEIATLMAFSFFSKNTFAENADNSVLFYSGAFVSKAIMFVIAFFISIRRKTSLSPVPFYYHLLLLFIIYICVGLSYVNVILVNLSGEPVTIYHLLSEIAIIMMSILVFFVFERFQIFAEHEEHTAIIEQHLSHDESRFYQINAKNDELNGLRHDLVNHLTSIRGLTFEKQYDKLIDYLDEYLPKALGVLLDSITGNPSVDVLLSEKIAVAENENIDIKLNIKTSLDISVSPVHLNIIVGNALDNAIEACRKLPDYTARYIIFDIKTENEVLGLRVVNSSLPVKIVAHELPRTDKDDKNHHGMGLNIVKQLIDRYGGSMRCSYENGEFIFYMRISNSNLIRNAAD